MRRKPLVAVIPGVGLALIAASAGWAAGLVRGGATYSGRGADYLNNAPKWTKEATEPASLRTSANGREVLRFAGTYVIYCGGATDTMRFANIPIVHGSFSARLKEPNREPDGKVFGEDYAAVVGRFLPGGKVSVSYLFDGNEGRTLSHPYSMTDPRAVGCGSLVHATLRSGR